MKKFNKILPLLAMLLLLIPGTTAEAARTEKWNAGTKKASITVELKDVLSCEGEVIAGTKDQKTSVKVEGVKAAATQGAFCETNGNKLFMVASQSGSLTVTIDVSVSGDGTYYIYLDGGVTDKDGTYVESLNDKDYLEAITLEVGTTGSGSTGSSGTSGSSSGSSSSSSSGSSSSSSSDKDKTSTTETKKDTTTTDTVKDKTVTTTTTGSGKNAVDYTALKQALENADALISDNDELKEWQTLINQMNSGTLLLNSESQEQVDEVAREIQELIDKMSGDSKEDGGNKKSPSRSSLGSDRTKYIIIIAALALLIILGCILIWWLRRKKKRENNYDGAPMVDYDIGDDD